MEYILIIELAILIAMVLIRSAMLRRNGINAIVFGDTDKTDFFIPPIVLCFFYAMIVPIFNLPLPEILKIQFWNIDVLIYLAIVLCTVSLIWFAITLKIFGNSFRVGIDENTDEKLITSGTFALSRNPIYIAFIAFFFGVFISYPTIVTLLFLTFLSTMVHRQILREEEFLKSHYGKEFEEYSAKVRRYI
ncbi:MAG: isoprenylcysteine carboxylmethyltransferase family protein [Methanobrevibacter sp.]|nr:isoprenylcysteine carboxylmethyltransferase family protein [Methanobrevibacter sp.]